MGRRNTSVVRTQEELAEIMSKPLVVVTKAGGFSRVKIWHLALFDSSWAACGEHAAAAFTSSGEPTLTCPRCIRLRDKYHPEVIFYDDLAPWRAAYARRVVEMPPEPPKTSALIDPNRTA